MVEWLRAVPIMALVDLELGAAMHYQVVAIMV